MITGLAHETRNRSGKGGVRLIRKNGGGKGRTRRVKKRQYMKVIASIRKGNSGGTKRELIVVQTAGILRKANTLGYVPSEFPAPPLSFPVDSMDVQDYCESPDSLKGWKNPSQTVVPKGESIKGRLQEESPEDKKKDSRECSMSEVVLGNAVLRKKLVGNLNDNPTEDAEEERGSRSPKLKAMTHYLTQMTKGLIHLLYNEKGDHNQTKNKGRIRRRDEGDIKLESAIEEGNKKFKEMTHDIGDCVQEGKGKRMDRKGRGGRGRPRQNYQEERQNENQGNRGRGRRTTQSVAQEEAQA